jgi:predicted sugar kinase
MVELVRTALAEAAASRLHPVIGQTFALERAADAHSGIGKATALALARMGATVVMVCRDGARGSAARQELVVRR